MDISDILAGESLSDISGLLSEYLTEKTSSDQRRYTSLAASSYSALMTTISELNYGQEVIATIIDTYDSKIHTDDTISFDNFKEYLTNIVTVKLNIYSSATSGEIPLIQNIVDSVLSHNLNTAIDNLFGNKASILSSSDYNSYKSLPIAGNVGIKSNYGVIRSSNSTDEVTQYSLGTSESSVFTYAVTSNILSCFSEAISLAKGSTDYGGSVITSGGIVGNNINSSDELYYYTSMCRTELGNIAVRGETDSLHISNNALDMSCVNSGSRVQVQIDTINTELTSTTCCLAHLNATLMTLIFMANEEPDIEIYATFFYRFMTGFMANDGAIDNIDEIKDCGRCIWLSSKFIEKVIFYPQSQFHLHMQASVPSNNTPTTTYTIKLADYSSVATYDNYYDFINAAWSALGSSSGVGDLSPLSRLLSAVKYGNLTSTIINTYRGT